MDLFVVFPLLGLSCFLFFALNKNAQLKRAMLPGVIIVMGLLWFFVNTNSMSGVSINEMIFFLLGFCVVFIVGIRQICFCDKCGATNYSRIPLGTVKLCSNCGAELKKQSGILSIVTCICKISVLRFLFLSLFLIEKYSCRLSNLGNAF